MFMLIMSSVYSQAEICLDPLKNKIKNLRLHIDIILQFNLLWFPSIISVKFPLDNVNILSSTVVMTTVNDVK